MKPAGVDPRVRDSSPLHRARGEKGKFVASPPAGPAASSSLGEALFLSLRGAIGGFTEAFPTTTDLDQLDAIEKLLQWLLEKYPEDEGEA